MTHNKITSLVCGAFILLSNSYSEVFSIEEVNAQEVDPEARQALKDQATEATALPFPFNISIGYLRHRSDTQSGYRVGDGLRFGSSLELNHNVSGLSQVVWGGRVAYLISSELAMTSPSAEMLNQTIQERMSTSGGNIIQTLEPTDGVERELGWRHRAAIGLSLGIKREWSSFISTVGVGLAQWRHDQKEASIYPVICADLKLGWVWSTFGWRGDLCQGQREAAARLLMGLQLGRARLGGGWGVFDLESAPQLLDEGGPLANVNVPISGPLYLGLDAWFPNVGRLFGTYSASERKLTREGWRWEITLTWTGEEMVPEIEKKSSSSPQQTLPAGKPSSPLQRQAPDQSPFMPNPSRLTPSPLNPQRGPPTPL